MQIDPARVVIPDRKLVGYLLSRTHPVGRHKSEFFRRLGYTPDRSFVLAADLAALLASNAKLGELTKFGQKVLSRGLIVGPGGRAGRVLAVWIILSGSSSIRFVTAYPED